MERLKLEQLRRLLDIKLPTTSQVFEIAYLAKELLAAYDEKTLVEEAAPTEDDWQHCHEPFTVGQ